MVFGGYGKGGIAKSSTEIYSYSDDSWRFAGNLPSTIWGMSAASLNNKLLLFGEIQGVTKIKLYVCILGGKTNERKILEFNPETESWSNIGAMLEARLHNRVTIVSFADYVKWCKWIRKY